ncbi:MAG: hypothetical protein JWL69_275 [Phycisphaerales bacterium]|jgi:hypothetical protein|nr:hypothetical protein [Phycisphaerales bacterium]
MRQHSKAKAMVLALTLSFLAHWIALPSQGASSASHAERRTEVGTEHPAVRPLGVAGTVAAHGIAWPNMAMDTSTSDSAEGN